MDLDKSGREMQQRFVTNTIMPFSSVLWLLFYPNFDWKHILSGQNALVYTIYIDTSCA